MLEYETVKQLLSLPKKVKKEETILETVGIDNSFPFCMDYLLMCEQNNEYVFWYSIKQSKKYHLKLSLYLMVNDTRVGLIRIDYNGQHDNPMLPEDQEIVPLEFRIYAGKHFHYNEPHIHYSIEDFKPMAWAIPLSDIKFSVDKIHTQVDIGNAFLAFNKWISLHTQFQFKTLLL
jgi:hypothetical protein